MVSYMPIFDNYLSLFTVYMLDFINPTHSQTITLNISKFLSNTHDLGAIGILYLLAVFTLFFNNYENGGNFGKPTGKIVLYNNGK